MRLSNPCSWCVSPMRQAVEDAIASGEPISKAARTYGLSRDQWRKHKLHGITTLPNAASLGAIRVEVLEGGGGSFTIIPRLETLLLQIGDLKDKWESKPSIVVQLLRLERDILGDLAKLRGEHPDKPKLSLDQLPQWPLILQVLDEHPEARRHVRRALHDGN